MLTISDVRIARPEAGDNDRVRAYVSFVLCGCFAVKNCRLIEGERGHFLAMPGRELKTRCGHCGGKNRNSARYCNHCGGPCEEKPRAHADHCHAINDDARVEILSAVLAAYAGGGDASGLKA